MAIFLADERTLQAASLSSCHWLTIQFLACHEMTMNVCVQFCAWSRHEYF